jgi:hypothetical protein
MPFGSRHQGARTMQNHRQIPTRLIVLLLLRSHLFARKENVRSNRLCASGCSNSEKVMVCLSITLALKNYWSIGSFPTVVHRLQTPTLQPCIHIQHQRRLLQHVDSKLTKSFSFWLRNYISQHVSIYVGYGSCQPTKLLFLICLYCWTGIYTFFIFFELFDSQVKHHSFV